MNTSHVTTSTNSDTYPHNTANIPLPPGTPPPLQMQHNQQHQQHHQQQLQAQHQHQHQLYQQHLQQQHQQHQRQLFGGVAQPMSFESLAKRNENVVASTLQQYGPGMGIPMNQSINHHASFQGIVPRMQSHISPQVQHQQNLHRMQIHQQQQTHLYRNHFPIQPPAMMLNQQTNIIRPPQRPVYQINTNSSTSQPSSVTISRSNPTIPVYNIAPINTSSTSHSNSYVNRSGANIDVSLISQAATATISSTSSSRPSSSERTDGSDIGVQPVASNSPPLDELNTTHGGLSIPESVAESSYKAKSPPQRINILSEVKERCELMTMNQMLEEYRCLKEKLEDSQERRATLEREINDIVRRAPGQNVELNPAFKRKKSQKCETDAKCREINDAIKFVADKLDKKFSHKVQDHEIKQPLQTKKLQRAKMSTAAPSSNITRIKLDNDNDRDNKEDDKYLLYQEEADFWCRCCDIHCKNLKEYCDHLHKRDHTLIMSKITPWRREGKPPIQLDKFRTFNRYKAICNTVSGRLRLKLTVSDIDEALYPAIKDRSIIKKIFFNRERKQFERDDRLFQMKGYEYLIPIQGFYCKICNKTMCDLIEAEEHLKSYNHAYEHTKNVALDGEHEKKIRLDMEKSLKVQREEERRKQHKNQDREPISSRQNSSSGGSNTNNRNRNNTVPSKEFIVASSSGVPSNAPVSSSTASAPKPTTIASIIASVKTTTALTPALTSSASKSTAIATTIFSTSATTAASSSSSKNLIAATANPNQWSARLPYKKPTSKIVDEHDVIADKFDRRDGNKDDGPPLTIPSTKPSTSHLNMAKGLFSGSSRPATVDRRKDHGSRHDLPEILPVSKFNQSSALKRLRADKVSEQDDELAQSLKKLNELKERKELEKEKVDHFEGHYTARLESSSDEDDNDVTSTRREKRIPSVVDVQNDDDGETINEAHLEPGDPNSPFPELRLVVTGNTPISVLKDERLTKQPRVVLNRINLNDYKSMLMVESGLWARVDQLLTKKENYCYQQDLEGVTRTEACFFQPNGDKVPINLETSDSDSENPLDPNLLQNFFCEK